MNLGDYQRQLIEESCVLCCMLLIIGTLYDAGLVISNLFPFVLIQMRRF